MVVVVAVLGGIIVVLGGGRGALDKEYLPHIHLPFWIVFFLNLHISYITMVLFQVWY